MRTPQAWPEGAAERWAAMLKGAKNKAEYQPIQWVWLRAALGLPASQMATALGWQVGSVRQVHSDSLRQGEAVLQSNPCGGRHRQNLTREQEQERLAPFLEQAAAGGVLVVAPVQAAYEAAVGRPVHHSVVYRALHRQGWRKIVPRPKHPKADEEAREAFKNLPEFVQKQVAEQTSLASPGLPVRLMFQDEARFGRISDPRRCWAPAGVRPEVYTQVVREYEYAFAALSPHDGTLDSLVLPAVHAEARSVFLAEVSQHHPGEWIVMVLDGAGWHKAKRLQVPANMRLVFLLPWSPQLNPVEHLWDEVREKWFANQVFHSMSAVEEQLLTALKTLEEDSSRVASLTGFDWIRTIPLNAN